MQTSGPRKGPYFQFVQSRLLASPFLGTAFPVYYDAFSSSQPLPGASATGAGDKPYLYFSSGGKANGYNLYPAWAGSDCFTFNVWPYVQQAQTQTLPALYYKPDTFQIVCAGRDQQFGLGCPPTLNNGLFVFNNVWQPSLGAGNFTSPATSSPFGMDDMSNFYNLTLGTTP